MANRDVTETLAGKFVQPALSLKEQLIIEALARYAVGLTATLPSNSVINTTMQSALQIMKPGTAFPLQAIRTAMCWQAAVSILNTGIFVATSTPSTILGAIPYLRGYSEDEIRAFCAYCEGRQLSVFT